MITKYQPHKSSLGGLPANIVVLIIWFVPAILNVLILKLAIFVLLIPFIVLLVEKKSGLVRNHAGQVLIFNILINILIWLIVLVPQVNFSGGLIALISMIGMVGLAIFGVSIGQFIFVIIACVKGWKWKTFTLPIIGKLGNWFTEEVKLN